MYCNQFEYIVNKKILVLSLSRFLCSICTVHFCTLWYTFVHFDTLWWYTLVHFCSLSYTFIHFRGTLWYTLVHFGTWCTFFTLSYTLIHFDTLKRTLLYKFVSPREPKNGFCLHAYG